MISATSLRVDYENVTAVYDLDFEVEPGDIYGLVGPNGAGKTSTIKALAGIIEPTYGEIRLAGFDMELNPEAGWERLGYMPDFSPVYENLKVWEYLYTFATAHQIPRDKRLDRARAWADRVALTDKWDTFVRELSRGMRQRLVLAKTMLHEPSVLLLDEPASGMDPIGRADMRAILKEAAAHGAAVLISSHILAELSDFCTAIGVMEKGRMIVSGGIDGIRARVGSVGQLHVQLAEPDDAALTALETTLSGSALTDHVHREPSGEVRAAFRGDDAEAAALLAQLVGAGVRVAGFHVEKEDIEDIFMKIGAREVS